MTCSKTCLQPHLHARINPKAFKGLSPIGSIACALASMAFVASSLALTGCGDSDSPWTRSAADPAPLLASPTTQKALSDKVPAEAVAMALVTGSKGGPAEGTAQPATATLPTFPSLLDFWLGGRCGPQPATQLSSRSIATGSFPAFRIQGSIHCPTQDYTWDLVVTTQMRIVSARMDSMAVEPTATASTDSTTLGSPDTSTATTKPSDTAANPAPTPTP
jgi:hypothetical protein